MKLRNDKKQRVLILCTGNSARSQMAEGLLRDMAGDQFEVFSAGVAPSSVRPEAIEVMREEGIDISGQRSKSVDEFSGQEFDYVITVCDNANQECPVFPGKTRRIHWSVEDPAAAKGNDEARLRVFRRVRDELRDRLSKSALTAISKGTAAKTIAISIRCLHCREWIPAQISFEDRESFDAEALFDDLAACFHCGELTRSNQENFRATFEGGEFLGEEIKP